MDCQEEECLEIRRKNILNDAKLDHILQLETHPNEDKDNHDIKFSSSKPQLGNTNRPEMSNGIEETEQSAVNSESGSSVLSATNQLGDDLVLNSERAGETSNSIPQTTIHSKQISSAEEDNQCRTDEQHFSEPSDEENKPTDITFLNGSMAAHSNEDANKQLISESTEDHTVKLSTIVEQSTPTVRFQEKMDKVEKCSSGKSSKRGDFSQDLEAKCKDLSDQNESLMSQLEERERFLEDILADIDEFKNKTKRTMVELKTENVKLKEVARSQVNKFSIERGFMLKENEFLKQRIEYLNEDMKFYTERYEKESSEKELEVFLESKPEETDLENLRAQNKSLQIEVESSINLITTLEKNLENKNMQIDFLDAEFAKLKQLEKIKMEIETQTIAFSYSSSQNEFTQTELNCFEKTAGDDDFVKLETETRLESIGSTFLDPSTPVAIPACDQSVQTDARLPKICLEISVQTDERIVNRNEFETLQSKYSETLEINEKLETMILEKIEEIEPTAEKLFELKDQIDELRTQNSNLVETNRKSLQEKQSEIESLLLDLSSKTKELEVLEWKWQEEKNRLSELFRTTEDSLVAANQKLEYSNSKNEDLEQKIKLLNQQLESITESVALKEKRLSEVTEELEREKISNEQTLHELEIKHESELDRLNNEIGDLENKKQTVEKLLADSTEELEEILSSQQKLQANYDQLKAKFKKENEKQSEKVEKLRNEKFKSEQVVIKQNELIEQLKRDFTNQKNETEQKIQKESLRAAELERKIRDQEREEKQLAKQKIDLTSKETQTCKVEMANKETVVEVRVQTALSQTENFCGEINPSNDVHIQTESSERDEEMETLKTNFGNLEVEFNMAQVEHAKEVDELRQTLYDSQQECASYQATMVQMKNHYEQLLQKSSTANNSSSEQPVRHKVKTSSLQPVKSSNQHQLEFLKQQNETLREENGKLKLKLETKVEVLDEINEKIATIATSLSIRRPIVQRKPSRQSNRSRSISNSTMTDEENSSRTAGHRYSGTRSNSSRNVTEDTGFSSCDTPSLSQSVSQNDATQMQNLHSYLLTIKTFLEDIREQNIGSDRKSPERNTNANRTQLGYSKQVDTTLNLTTVLEKKEMEILNFKKQLDERDEYISQRSQSKLTGKISYSREAFDHLVGENLLLKSQLQTTKSKRYESEQKASRLAKQLEKKVESDIFILDDLQSKVVTVTNSKQREIADLEQSLQKALKENSFLKDELKRLHQKLLDNRHTSSSFISQSEMPDIDRNPIAFITQLRNLYNKSP